MKKILSLTLASVLMLSIFAGCTSDKPEESVVPEVTPEIVEMTPEEQAQAYIDAITAARTEEENTYFNILTPFNEAEVEGYEMILQGLGITSEIAENYAISLSLMNTQAYAIVLVKPVEGQEEAVSEVFQAFIDLQLMNFDRYLMDQYEIAQNANVTTLEDGTMMLVMAENAETMATTIADTLAE